MEYRLVNTVEELTEVDYVPMLALICHRCGVGKLSGNSFSLHDLQEPS